MSTNGFPRELWAVAGPFAVSGVLHLVKPQVFEPIIPKPLRGHSRELVIASGVAELACAAGLAHPKTRQAAGAASAALLVAIWPANVQMSIDLAKRSKRDGDRRSKALFIRSLVRLPLQIPLIGIAARAASRRS